MRKYARKDGNHDAIFKAWRDAGASVLSLASLGDGAPDALVCWQGKYSRAFGTPFDPKYELALVEIKDGSRKPSEQLLTPDELKFHASWPGKVHIVHNVQEALEIIK